MNCQQANQIDLVEYLATLGFKAEKIRGNDYWYRSPLRAERNASFKVNTIRNIWYDHGEGVGGTVADFVMRFYTCDLQQALVKIGSSFSFIDSSPYRKPENAIPEDFKSLAIIEVLPIQNRTLLEYLQFRRIDEQVARKFCKEIVYENNGNKFRALGFKNNAGGYELRSETFKGSSSPKYVSWFNNRANSISVFEGFFDFLTWQSMNKFSNASRPNFLVLNSLSFFTRSLLLQEKHERIHLYLDNDNAGRKCVQEIQKRSPDKVLDESRQYKDFKDLNDWFIEKQLQRYVKQAKQQRL
jgi:DNA primase